MIVFGDRAAKEVVKVNWNHRVRPVWSNSYQWSCKRSQSENEAVTLMEAEMRERERVLTGEGFGSSCFWGPTTTLGNFHGDPFSLS